MESFLIKLYYSNLDENLNTRDQASICFSDVRADNLLHAHLLAEKLEKKLGADWYEVIHA